MSEPTGLPWEIRLICWAFRLATIPWLHFVGMAASLAWVTYAWRAGDVGSVLVAVLALIEFTIMGITSALLRWMMRDG